MRTCEIQALANHVCCDWPRIRAGLLSQLSKRGQAGDEALQDAACWMWEFLVDGLSIPPAIWKAAARVAEGRSFVRKRELEDGSLRPPNRRCIERMRAAVHVTKQNMNARERRLSACCDR